MDTSAWETLKLELDGWRLLIIVRTLARGCVHVSVDTFHEYVRPNVPLSRWSSEIRQGRGSVFWSLDLQKPFKDHAQSIHDPI